MQDERRRSDRDAVNSYSDRVAPRSREDGSKRHPATANVGHFKRSIRGQVRRSERNNDDVFARKSSRIAIPIASLHNAGDFFTCHGSARAKGGGFRPRALRRTRERLQCGGAARLGESVGPHTCFKGTAAQIFFRIQARYGDFVNASDSRVQEKFNFPIIQHVAFDDDAARS